MEPQECRHSTSPRVGLSVHPPAAELPLPVGLTGAGGRTATLHEFPTGKKDELALAKLFRVGVVVLAAAAAAAAAAASEHSEPGSSAA